MKNKSILALTSIMIASFFFSGCSNTKDFLAYWISDGKYGKKEEVEETKPTKPVEETTVETTEPAPPLIFLPEKSEVDAICQLATLDCYYHNVAKSVKYAGTGLEHIGEVNRKFWIEYDATARIGIDFNQVQMSINDETGEITIILPPAQIIGVVNADPNSYDITSYIEEPDKTSIAGINIDSINKNPITVTDINEAISESLEELRVNIMSDTALLQRARERAKDLIESYISQLAALSDVDYTIVWIYAEEVVVQNS